MAKKKEILAKIRILLTQTFKDPEEAFKFFDKDGDKHLDKSELVALIKYAKINGFIAGIAAKKMIKGLDKSKDKRLNWPEFKKAVSALL